MQIPLKGRNWLPATPTGGAGVNTLPSQTVGCSVPMSLDDLDVDFLLATCNLNYIITNVTQSYPKRDPPCVRPAWAGGSDQPIIFNTRVGGIQTCDGTRQISSEKVSTSHQTQCLS